MNMPKYKFFENVWITFYYNNSYYIGRTLKHNNIESVVCISEHGRVRTILYDQITLPKKLKVLKDNRHTDIKTINNNIYFDLNAN